MGRNILLLLGYALCVRLFSPSEFLVTPTHQLQSLIMSTFDVRPLAKVNNLSAHAPEFVDRLQFRARLWLLTGCLTLVAWAMPGLPSRADLFDGPVDRLPVPERVALREGKPVVVGENGFYTARILVKAPPKVVWSVLTDYGNFSEFLPNVIESRILEADGDRKVVEQVRQQQVFVVTVRSRVRYEAREIDQQKIEFKLIEGDLTRMEGFWLIEPVAPHPLAEPDQILITQQILAEPSGGTPKDTFNNIFKGSLTGNLLAIREEIKRRISDQS